MIIYLSIPWQGAGKTINKKRNDNKADFKFKKRLSSINEFHEQLFLNGCLFNLRKKIPYIRPGNKIASQTQRRRAE